MKLLNNLEVDKISGGNCNQGNWTMPPRQIDIPSTGGITTVVLTYFPQGPLPYGVAVRCDDRFHPIAYIGKPGESASCEPGEKLSLHVGAGDAAGYWFSFSA